VVFIEGARIDGQDDAKVANNRRNSK